MKNERRSVTTMSFTDGSTTVYKVYEVTKRCKRGEVYANLNAKDTVLVGTFKVERVNEYPHTTAMYKYMAARVSDLPYLFE